VKHIVSTPAILHMQAQFFVTLLLGTNRSVNTSIFLSTCITTHLVSTVVTLNTSIPIVGHLVHSVYHCCNAQHIHNFVTLSTSITIDTLTTYITVIALTSYNTVVTLGTYITVVRLSALLLQDTHYILPCHCPSHRPKDHHI
jgi:hypothetical protein